MKHFSTNSVAAILSILFAVFLISPEKARAVDPFPGVCGQGTGIPPFLSSGAKPNLLMVLDNSGSMLDMAYIDTTAGAGECSDNSFDNTLSYAGVFEPDMWYRWTAGEKLWASGTAYVVGDVVYTEGVFYRAMTSGTSTDEEIKYDTGVIWERLGEIPPWTNGETYAADSFVQYKHQLYHTPTGGVANDVDALNGISIDEDSVTWIPVETTWLNDFAYSAGDVVNDNGMLYIATAAGTSSGIDRADDSGVAWARLDEGYFEEVPYDTVLDAASAFLNKPGTAYAGNDIYLKIITVGGKQSGVSSFAATGNLLNWASASKFDIQKKILTGGKYDQDQQELIGQSRGCSSRGFVKEVPVIDQSDGSADVLSLSVRGSTEENWISTSDDTTRINILGVSDDGFVGSDQEQACQNAIEEVSKGENANQGQLSQYVDDCLAYTGDNNILAESNSAYNHSIHTCWSAVTKNYTQPGDFGNLSEIYNSCESIYDGGVPPASIEPTNSGYMCYGVYNSTIPDARTPTGTGSDRLGYLGRCWEPGSSAAGCEPVVCGGTGYDYNTGNPRCLDDGLVYQCSGNYNSNRDACNKPWTLKTQDADPDDGIICDTSAPASPGFWTDDLNPNTADGCAQEAMWDYCGSLSIPEVIDPSEQVFNTGDTWGMPGAMVDYGITAMFGTDRPLLVMKGYVQSVVVPEGILDEVAEQLRIGAMAFNDNGAETECNISLSSADDTIDRFCPAQNRDGAGVIASIRDGNEITDTVTGTTHLEDLKTAVNEVRATAWTPLAEALYNAVGYYGQNDSFRLDADDFAISAADDPVQYWCQENYVLVITEGASTADLHPDVSSSISALATAGVTDSTVTAAEEGECMKGTAADDHDLFGSTYLDDIAYFGKNAHDAGIYTMPTITTVDGITEQKRDITTYMVVAGTPRNQTVGSNVECNPYQLMTNTAENGGTSLYTGENPDQLEANLKDVFSDILSRVSAGSAASVISSSRSGEGAVYQAIFWPEINRAVGEDPLLWVGDVHSFFIDENGRLWDDYSFNDPATKGALWSEDTNGNGLLDANEDKNNNNALDGDRRIITFYNPAANSTQICFNPLVQETGVCSASDYVNTPLVVDLRDFDDYLWSVRNNLESISDYSSNRGTIVHADPTLDGTWDYTDNYRHIFTWNDLDNDGIVDFDHSGDGAADDDGDAIADRNEVLPFVSGMASAAVVTVTPALFPRQDIVSDFNVADETSLDKLIEWIRGGHGDYEQDLDGDGILDFSEDINGNGVRDYVFRCRKTDCDPAASSSSWLLGDVIHSTPTLVGRPAEGYHFIYQDNEYAQFYKKYRNRRHVIYFGGNDGMLHAVNGGFYQAGLNKFLPCRTDQRDPVTNTCLASAPYDSNPGYAYPSLGDELWAYVPYNLQPQLSCLTDPEYNHKYFVDGPPRVFDVRIFPDDDIHPGGWGTILVGYMRYGGSPVSAGDSVTIPATPNRDFVSSYFILDITDPERPPTLLAEMSNNDETYDYGGGATAKYTDIGYTTAMPTVIVMRDVDGSSEWFLVFGNGPTTIAGENTNQGKVAIVPLNSLTGVNWKTNGGNYISTERQPFRIPDREPVSNVANAQQHFGRFLIPAHSGGLESFVGDMVTVDFDINTKRISKAAGSNPYKSDAVYFGTVDGSGFMEDSLTNRDYWNGDGRMYRLITRSTTTNATTGHVSQDYTYPASWSLHKLIDAQGPITAAPNIGYDTNNFWVYFGTGRFFDSTDKTDDAKQYFFGVKEPYTNSTSCDFSWDAIDWWSGSSATAANPGNDPGSQGLLRTDPVRVIEKYSSSTFNVPGNYVYCDDDGVACTLPLTPVLNSDIDDEHAYYAFADLENYITGEKCGTTSNGTIGIDGWYREFTEPRERSLGMPTLLGGLVTYTSYQPFADLCKSEGVGSLYGVYFKTGTAWYEDVFGTYQNGDTSRKTIVKAKLQLGKGLATTPSLQVGTGQNDAKAFIQTSTGEIIEVAQETLPIDNFKSGRTQWRMK